MVRDVRAAARKIKTILKSEPKIGVILGSGLGSLVDAFEDSSRIKYADIPHFPHAAVKGHKGEVVAGRFFGVNVLAFAGRVHFYEGYTMQKIVFPVRVMAELGIETLIITNAGGAVNESYTPGDIVVISDHINMLGDNPLRGAPDFIDMTEAYSVDLRTLAIDVARKLGIQLKEGVYMVLNGPSFETPAEIRMARILGADIVGMSTIPEVITANSHGIKVLGLSVMTNMAAGITGGRLTHEEVIETTESAAEQFKRLVSGIIANLMDE
jgi:purine-nucleoside phosphorylase